MESTAAQIQEIVSKTREVIETRVKLCKLKAVDKGSEVISSLSATVIVLVLALLFFVFLSFGLAYLIGEWLGKVYYGFLIMAGIYGLAGLLIYSFRKKFIKGPVSNRLIDRILN